MLAALALCAGLGQATAQDSIERLPLDPQVFPSEEMPAEGDDLPALDDNEPGMQQFPAAEQPAPKVAAPAQRIKNPVAEFAGLDKITGRIITFDVYIDETVQFGALQVTPRVCYSRPETEEPQDGLLRRGRRDHARPQDPPHLHRLDVRREPRPQCRRARRL